MNYAAGCRIAVLRDDEIDAASPLLVIYPSHAAERATPLGPYTLDVAMHAPVADGTYPLVVISHGTGSSHLLHRGLAAHLARAGFVVMVPEHPGNNRNDNALADTDTNLARRPRSVRRAIDWAYADETLGAHLVPDAVAIVGHSLGGYTALAVAGGHPTAFARETADRQPRAIAVTPDDRVRALVLLAPATAWFMAPDALRDVHAPILLLTAEHDPHTPGWHADVVRRGVSDAERVTHRMIANAGHFSFLAPFPESMRRPDFAPANDPPGFDRVQFHGALYPEIASFLRDVL